MIATPTMHRATEKELLYRGPAMAQLNILREQMKLGGHVIGRRTIKLSDGAVVECNICFNNEQVRVIVPPITQEPNPVIVEVKTLMLVAVPRKAATGFPLGSEAADQYGLQITSCDPLAVKDISLLSNIDRGNYHIVMPDCMTVYSIKAPVHHLAGSVFSENINSYTQFSWTSTVSANDTYTCFSEHVYKNGEIFESGLDCAPPEDVFTRALIVGIGIDEDGVLHKAQLVKIEKGKGYWLTEFGMCFGTEDTAVSLAQNKPYSKIWVNDTDGLWFVEFFTGNKSGGALFSGVNIYDRVAAGRDVGQLFYRDGSWSGNTARFDVRLSFPGLVAAGNVTKLSYAVNAISAKLNGSDISFSHSASSESGMTGVVSSVVKQIMLNPTYSMVRINETTAEAGCSDAVVAYQRLSDCHILEVHFRDSLIPKGTKSGTPNPLDFITVSQTNYFEACDVQEYEADGSWVAANGYYSGGNGYIESCGIQMVYNYPNANIWSSPQQMESIVAGLPYAGTLILYYQPVCDHSSWFGYKGYVWFYAVQRINIDDRYLSDSYFSNLTDASGNSITIDQVTPRDTLMKCCRVVEYRSGVE